MTLTSSPPTRSQHRATARFRLNRAGVLNVWQYDEQEFEFADGRLLLRGANGAGKSKTLEMLLPFALDGDKARVTASAKHHTSLLWLMTDGYDGQARVGYVWVEFLRVNEDGADETFTCGVGIRASVSARTATAWHFTTSLRIGRDLFLEDDAGPLSRPRLEELLGADGQVFEKASAYKDHVGSALFGLDPTQYDEVLRLLYWLRQPQIGEDIEPAKLAQQLSQALPQLDEQAVRSAGDTFDELTAFGEQIERRAAAAVSLAALAEAYGGYARAVVAERARAVQETLRAEHRLRSEVHRTQRAVAVIGAQRVEAEATREAARGGIREDDARLRALEDSPEFRDQRRLAELADRVDQDERIAAEASTRRDRQAETVHRHRTARAERLDGVRAALTQNTDRLRDLDRRQQAAVPGSSVSVPAFLDALVLERLEQSAAVRGALDLAMAAIEGARGAASRRLAAVGIIRGGLVELAEAAAAQQQAEQEAERAESRWEAAREARLEADRDAAAEIQTLENALDSWTTAPFALPTDVLPEELTEETVPRLPVLARDAAAPELTRLHHERAQASSSREMAGEEITRLTAERATVEGELDPAPPPPVLPRTERTDGVSLWQVVDFAPGLEDVARAGLEAALQASGLLDAWLRPGGLLLDAAHLDVVLAPSGASGPGTLASLLVPDLPPESGVSVDDVRRVLATVGDGADSEVIAWARTDGSWRLGPARGRAAKDQAQYVGSTARAQERERRLALIDAALAEQRQVRSEAAQKQADFDAALVALTEWVDAVPSGQALLRAWTRLEERTAGEAREEQENRQAQEAAHAARTIAAEARARLERLAAEQDLPAEQGRLDRIEEQLRGLAADLLEAARQDPTVRERLTRWEDAVGEAERSATTLAAEERLVAEATQRAEESRAELEALRSSVGDSVEELQRKIAEVRRSRRAGEETARAAEEQAVALTRAEGEAEADARNARDRLTEQLDQRVGMLAQLVAVGDVPGMLTAAGAGTAEATVVLGLAGHPADEPVGKETALAADVLAALSQDEVNTAVTRVWRTYNDAASGPAADHQLAVAEYADLVAVSGRDDVGEAAVVILAQRVSAGVAQDRGLLTEREKQQFEQHVLGELGDAIRLRRRDAEELVTAMNDQLGKVTTSQGIRVRLVWKLRDDVPPEARAAVELLAQPVGALIPEERATLRDVLHRLIEASRAERPELSYGEHLAAALDYRTWSEFAIRYTRPEKPGHWERLHRRSPLSQGEQKVLCYLPLFAAAAAHFTSLAGAAPHAPRLVFLDDAFPKIDVRTHPLLFGLLVQLDLDFVITSERLWGDHDTVPSLAIYEALRDPNQRGIAQYEYRWDGRALHALG